MDLPVPFEDITVNAIDVKKNMTTRIVVILFITFAGETEPKISDDPEPNASLRLDPLPDCNNTAITNKIHTKI
jgi:hypothetical protein